MLLYITHRLLNMVPLLFGITLLSFMVIQLAPGEPVALGGTLDPTISTQAADRLRAHFHLDAPLYTQYWLWLKGVLVFDFGTSFHPDGRPVLDKILERLPLTLWMNIIGLLIVLVIAIPLGVTAARYKNRFFDRATTVLVFIGFAAPGFWLALLALIYFGVELGWIPLSGLASYGADAWPLWRQVIDWGHHLITPILIGVLGSVAGLSRYMRTSMLEVTQQDFITTARAKGLPENLVFYRHGLRNALLPVVTILGLSIPGLIGGSVISETLFSLPGMGKLFYDAVLMRDYPLIMGILTLGAFLTLLGNLLADVAYGFADPRTRKSQSNITP